MSVQDPIHRAQHGAKTLGEGAICFGCALAALAAAAVVIQWAMNFLA